MYKIKQIPEDFIVKEILKLALDESGEYSYFLLKKKNLTTLGALQTISHELKIAAKNINYAGNKDKNAVTEQYISIKEKSKRLETDFSFKNIELKFLGRGKERIFLGKLSENEFELILRNLAEEDIEKLKKNIGLLKKLNYFLPNYFDEQRFSKKNFEIGKFLIKKEYKKASDLLKNDPQFPGLKDHLSKNPNDYIGALNKLNKRVLRLYVHAVQSYIFNETISNYISNFKNDKFVNYSLGKFCFSSQKIKNIKIPLAGFDSSLGDNKIENIIKEIMKKQNFNIVEFLNRQIPELTLEADNRNLLMQISNFAFTRISDDELNENMKKAKVKFTLPKGSYATMVVKFLLD